jgi:hypothetical protein
MKNYSHKYHLGDTLFKLQPPYLKIIALLLDTIDLLNVAKVIPNKYFISEIFNRKIYTIDNANKYYKKILMNTFFFKKTNIYSIKNIYINTLDEYKLFKTPLDFNFLIKSLNEINQNSTYDMQLLINEYKNVT